MLLLLLQVPAGICIFLTAAASLSFRPTPTAYITNQQASSQTFTKSGSTPPPWTAKPLIQLGSLRSAQTSPHASGTKSRLKTYFSASRSEKVLGTNIDHLGLGYRVAVTPKRSVYN